jgi:hypothetical protein
LHRSSFPSGPVMTVYVELMTGLDGVSSRPVRRIVLRA